MKITILTKKGKYLRFDTENPEHYKTSSEIFQFVENIWFEWFEHESGNNSELEEMYYGEEACYSKKGAILQAIEQIGEVAEETNKTFFKESELYTIVDIECAFN